eukprot:TRINITY_DN3857_c0_g1_i2.p2 TRINITY_DN3857_c0_g1~~TRINITY_DN3857_c0_g1_i2.p2  ORF type:complete len:109 (-),score=19.07 TRINITY_DN3857_c0_g1_i2:133-417(-)
MASGSQDHDALVRLLLLGAVNAGKTALLAQYSLLPTMTTIGAEFWIGTLKIGARSVCLQIWDTPGHGRFLPNVASYVPGSHAALLVYAVTPPLV